MQKVLSLMKNITFDEFVEAYGVTLNFFCIAGTLTLRFCCGLCWGIDKNTFNFLKPMKSIYSEKYSWKVMTLYV